jgi:hypothetical protein
MANRRNSREGLTSLALLPFVLAGGAHAAHPFITDDTETQGKGRFELERRTQYTRMAVADLTLANCQFQPQLTYAAEERLDLILRPTYSVASGGASPAPRVRGYQTGVQIAILPGGDIDPRGQGGHRGSLGQFRPRPRFRSEHTACVSAGRPKRESARVLRQRWGDPQCECARGAAMAWAPLRGRSLER